MLMRWKATVGAALSFTRLLALPATLSKRAGRTAPRFLRSPLSMNNPG